MWTGTTNHLEPGLLSWGVVIAVSLAAAIGDVRSHRISNRLTGSLLLGGLVWSLYVGGLSGLGWSLLATILIMAPFFMLWLLGGSGAGDAKMMGAVASWLGLAAGVQVTLAVGVAGGLLCLGWALARRHALTSLGNVAVMGIGWLTLLRNPLALVTRREMIPRPQSSTRVPYGLAIFAGIVATAAWRVLCAN